jgi:hypothetical protein
MAFLKQRFYSTGITAFICLLTLTLSGCLNFGATRVATIPLVIIEEVPIPEEAKQPISDLTLAKDSAISLWFMGSEGWESDALAKVMRNPAFSQAKSSYFEAYIERTFIGLLFANYERVRVKGKWVKMVPVKMPPLQIISVTPMNSVTNEIENNP